MDAVALLLVSVSLILDLCGSLCVQRQCRKFLCAGKVLTCVAFGLYVIAPGVATLRDLLKIQNWDG